MRRERLTLGSPLRLAETLSELKHGPADPTVRLAPFEAWLAFRTAEGAATLRLQQSDPTRLDVGAWGDGADAAVASVPALVGEHDAPARLVAAHPIVRELQRRLAGTRLPRSGRAFDALVPAVCEQKVTATEAHRAYAALVRSHGERAPGPGGLMLAPRPETLAGLPYHAFHPLGLERRRAEVIRRAATRAAWLDAAADAGDAARRLGSLPGIGPWTVAEVLRSAYGDADAISLGDYHVPNTIAWALAGEARADDARMLELLEPYRGQRGRVQRLVELARIVAPRRGPRLAPRSIAAI